MSVAIESAAKILLTPREAAEVLGISERKLWSLSAPRGPIPTVRIGKSVRYSVETLENWVEQQQSVQPGDAIDALARLLVDASTGEANE